MRLLRKNLAGCKRNGCTGPESSCARPYRRYARRRILTTVPRPALYNHTFGESIRARMLQCRGWRLEQHKNQSNRHVPRSSPTMLSSRRQVHRPAKSQQQQQAELMQPHLPGTPASTCAHFGYSSRVPRAMHHSWALLPARLGLACLSHPRRTQEQSGYFSYGRLGCVSPHNATTRCCCHSTK